MTSPFAPTAPAPSASLDLDAGLRRFGHASFLPGQREAIETLERERRLLLVAPTGGGKSLIYQLPASLLSGTTLVISPLISLMVDQCAALEARGVPATYLASTLDGEETRRRMRKVSTGVYDLVYVAPERLAFEGFRALVHRLRPPLVAVDEAHCVSEWGHDFRPDYLEIADLLAELPDSRVLATTATATPVVRDEIVKLLGLPPGTPEIVRGSARPNLALRAVETPSRAARRRHVDAVLREALGSPDRSRGAAIVYAPTRRATEEEARRLEDAGWRAVAYHAGLEGGVRDERQGRFLDRSADVVVATNAFGMGIDRPDVRAVVHLAPPGSIEAYYQEVGRAGRDGRDAVGLLCVSPGDLPLRRHLLESDGNGGRTDPEVVRHKWNLFLELVRWTEGGSCRHDAILRYFGDEEETLAGCGRCDVCEALARGESVEGEADAAEATVIVRKALSAVGRVHGRFGLTAAVKLLKGAEDHRLQSAGLDRTRTFGALAERSEEWLTRLLRRCVTAGWVDFDGGERPVVVLTKEGKRTVFGEGAVRFLLPPHRPAFRGSGRDPHRVDPARAAGAEALDPAERALFEALRRFRREAAREEGVPAYVVASDRTLRDVARLRPATLDELRQAHGIGPAKADRYGGRLLAVVREAAAGA